MNLNKFMVVGEKLSIWDIIWKYTIRDTISGILTLIPATPGVLLRMIYYKLFLKKCGKGLRVAEFVRIRKPEKLSIGDHVILNEFVTIDGDEELSIGDYTNIGLYVSIFTHTLNYKDKDVPIKLQPKKLKPVHIGKDVFLATGVIVMPGVTIGDGSVVAANSVVVNDIPPYSIAVGNPARVVQRRGK